MMNGIALGDDAFLFDCDAAGTIGIMQNNKTPSGQQPASTQTGLKFYERWDWDSSSESLNDKQSIEFTANYHDALLAVNRYNSLLAFCPGGREIQLGVRNSNADKFYLYHTSSTRGLWDSKLENRTGRPGSTILNPVSGAVIKIDNQNKVLIYADNIYASNITGDLEGSADKIDSYHISIGQTAGSDTNTIYFITD